MAEGGYEMVDFGRSARRANIVEYTESPLMDPAKVPPEMSPSYQRVVGGLVGKLQSAKEASIPELRQELLKTKVDAFFKAVASRNGLLLADENAPPYDAFKLEGTTLYLKDGDRRVTNLKNPAEFLTLGTIGPAAVNRTILPDYMTRTPAAVRIALDAVRQRTLTVTESKSTDTTDLVQHATEVDTAFKGLFRDASTITEGPSLRELLGLDEALRRQRGALVDNLAKLSQLDTDIAQAEQELSGEEATADPEKKRRIENLLQRLRDERTSRLEATAANREALRTQFSRIRETIERVLNEDTTLAACIRTLFQEHGVTIASIRTAIGFIMSTVVLAIQTVLGGGGGAALQPTPPSGMDWVKKQLKTLAGWLKKLAEKAAAALPGVIGAIVSWLLKTAGSVATWLAEHLWAVAAALVAATAVTLRRSRHRQR